MRDVPWHPWFQGPSCYACSCLSCNFARQSNRSVCVAVTIPRVEESALSVATRDQTNYCCPEKLVSGAHRSAHGRSLAPNSARRGRSHCSLDVSFAGLPTVSEARWFFLWCAAVTGSDAGRTHGIGRYRQAAALALRPACTEITLKKAAHKVSGSYCITVGRKEPCAISHRTSYGGFLLCRGACCRAWRTIRRSSSCRQS